MNSQIRIVWSVIFISIFLASPGYGASKKMSSSRAASALAKRALAESIYGLKILSTEEVVSMVAATYTGKSEAETVAEVKGIQITERSYDAEKDIARATAEVTLTILTNIDGKTMDLQGKTFSRVAFATSTLASAPALQAMRAAEIDAYKLLAATLVGFTLESQTTIENYMFTTDIVKTKVLATLYLAEVTEYGWDESGNAYIKMALHVPELEEILGERIENVPDLIEVTGQGAQPDGQEE